MPAISDSLLGKAIAYSLSETRLSRTVNKIIRGLYFHMLHQPLPVNSNVISMSLLKFREANHANDGMKLIEIIAKEAPVTILGSKAFSFQYAVWDDTRNATFWLLNFHECVYFVGSTGVSPDISNNDVVPKFSETQLPRSPLTWLRNSKQKL